MKDFNAPWPNNVKEPGVYMERVGLGSERRCNEFRSAIYIKASARDTSEILNPRNIEPTVYPIQGECPRFQNFGNFMHGLPRHRSGALAGAQ